MGNAFITITGINGYYGKNPFKIDRVLRIVKEPDNRHDAEAIRVELPLPFQTIFALFSRKVKRRASSQTAKRRIVFTKG